MMEYDLSKISFTLFIISVTILLILGLNKLFVKKLNQKEIYKGIVFVIISGLLKIIVKINDLQIKMNLINSFIIILFLFGIIKIIDYIVQKIYLENSKVKIPKLIHEMFLTIIYFILFFVVLKKNMGIDLTAIITTSAVLSMVIGLALQETLGNFIAGISIHVEKPFKMGDWVLVDNTEGKVVGINWRTTKLLTFNNSFLIIPNGKIIKDSILNFNYPTSNHILRIHIGVSYKVSPDKVKKTILEVVNKLTKNSLKKMVSEIYLVKYNDFSIDYEVRIWINDYAQKKRIEDEFMSKLWYAFKREKIKIPFPIRDIYQHNVVNKDGEDGKNQRKIELIKKVEFFNELSEEVIDKIAINSRLEKYGENELLFNKGDSGDSFFLIERGEIKLEINQNEVITIGKGNFFGEMALFTGKSRTARAIVKEEAVLLILDKEGFSKILLKDEKILSKISQIVVKRECENKDFEKCEVIKKIEIKESEMKMIQKIKSFFGI